MGSSDFLCKRCGKTVCKNCFTKKRQIAKLDPRQERVCDLCDVALDNVRLRYAQNKISNHQAKKNSILQHYIDKLEKRNNDLRKQLTDDQQKFPFQIQIKQEDFDEILQRSKQLELREIQQKDEAIELERNIGQLEEELKKYTKPVQPKKK